MSSKGRRNDHCCATMTRLIAITVISVLCLYTFVTIIWGDHLVSKRSSLVWGPGLKAEIVMPARYFIIQAVGQNGDNITDSIGEDAFEVHMTSGNDGNRARAWVQVLDRHDGTYIVRYKLYETVTNLKIEVLYNGAAVADSPYVLKGPVYHEKCNCPQPDMDTWLKDMQCPPSYRQIKQDLSFFPKIDMTVVAEEAIQRFNQRGRHSLCHYSVINNRIYRKTYGEHVGFKMFMDAILTSLARKVHLPDFELFVNLGDWPLENKKIKDKPIPIFSWCGSEETRDIVMPTYDITEATLETMGRCDNSRSIEMPTYEVSEESLKDACRVTLDMLSVQANTGPKWDNKSPIAFWRGRDSREERLNLVRMSRKHPDIVDAKLTNMFFFKHDKNDLGELVKHISFFDFFKYKYQISVDGTVAAYRFPYLLGGDSVVLKQDSKYYEHFYKQLKPYVHYIPFKHDLSDLLTQIQWAKDNDEKAKQIAKNAQEFVQQNLLARDVFCYHAVLFKEYSKRLKSPPQKYKGMEEVQQPSDSESHCHCQRLKQKEKEEL